MIRLACIRCDLDHADEIPEEELEVCVAEGWTDIVHVQTYEQATKENGDGRWWTHVGVCPLCSRANV